MQDEDNEDDDEEEEITLNNENQQQKIEQCKEKKRCLNFLLCCYNVLFKYRLYVSAYNNLFIAYKYVLSLSCTQIGCERSFSTLTFIKTRLRNRLSMDNLDAWMLMNLNKDILESLSFEDITNEVVQQSSVLKSILVV